MSEPPESAGEPDRWEPPAGSSGSGAWQPPESPFAQREDTPATAAWPAPAAPRFVQPGGETSTKATASLVLGICGLLVLPLVCSVLALVFGYQARGEIARSNGALRGEGNATAGIVLGWIGTIFGILAIVAIIALVAGTGVEVHDSGTGEI